MVRCSPSILFPLEHEDVVSRRSSGHASLFNPRSRLYLGGSSSFDLGKSHARDVVTVPSELCLQSPSVARDCVQCRKRCNRFRAVPGDREEATERRLSGRQDLF